MQVTISIPDALAYGASEGMPDSVQGQDPFDAAYTTAHGGPGGIAALAGRMRVSANTLTAKVNTQNTTHHLTLREAIDLMHFSGDASVLHAVAARLGYRCEKAMPDRSGGDPIEATVQLQRRVGEFTDQTGEAVLRLQRNLPPSKSDMRRCGEAGGSLIAAVDDLLAALRGRMRPEPAQEA